MCLAVAGRILSAEGEGVARTASVDLGGTPREISLAMLPEAVVGDWVIVHAGHALRVLSDAEAEELVSLSEEIAGIW
jgi:hydrogenase expression/formation protein HypC